MRNQRYFHAKENETPKKTNSRKRTTTVDDNLFRQFFDCTNYESVDLIAIVTNSNLNNELCERLERLIKTINKAEEQKDKAEEQKDKGEEHKELLYCLIMRKEMKRILYDFNKNHKSVLEQKYLIEY